MRATLLKLLMRVCGISAKLWDLCEPILVKEVGLLLEQIIPMALTYVVSLNSNNGMTPQQKQQAAFASVKSDIIAAGITASTSIINLAIEAAYNRTKLTNS